MTSRRSAKRKAPWKKAPPKASAPRREARGRRYPTLVDDMRIAAAKRSSGRTKAEREAYKRSRA
jgi:hypothetical protein